MNPTDIRMTRTRNHLWRALVDLIDERGYASLSVADLTARAEVNRTTFYRHYEDRDDLFRKGCTEFLRAIIVSLGAELQGLSLSDFEGLHRVLSGLFERIEGERRTFRVLASPRSNPEFLRLAHDHVFAFLVEVRQVPEIYAQAVTSMLVGLCLWWVQDRPETPARTMGQVYATLVTSGLQGLRALSLV